MQQLIEVGRGEEDLVAGGKCSKQEKAKVGYHSDAERVKC
jgi:hypothetical protein